MLYIFVFLCIHVKELEIGAASCGLCGLFCSFFSWVVVGLFVGVLVFILKSCVSELVGPAIGVVGTCLAA
uniref:Uncharacterized protein n=1 Tax=Arundo donax TaxID=35708 RepID=A0A0A8YL29_ARUDO